jgi:signal transduction histidine kinase
MLSEEPLIERLWWCLRLRWAAALGVALTVFLSIRIFRFSLPIFSLFSITAIVVLYNLGLYVFLSYAKKKSLLVINRIANLQISLDLFSLGLLIHFAGGIENPFVFYFIFHMIIASILLSRRAAYLQASFTAALFSSIVALEAFKILPHYCLEEFIINCQEHNLTYITGVAFVFISTLYIAVYMATSISAKLRQRERALVQANALLEEKDRIKSEYVLRVSHDIKEHLAAIEGCLEPVARGITGQLNPQQSDLIHRAAGRTAKLILFVSALLEITRIKLGREMKMANFSFREMLAEAVNSIAAKAKEKNISLHLDLGMGIDKIRGAKEYLQETFTNLLANSVKYTPGGGKIKIKVIDKGSYLAIEIIDTGIGIPQDEMPKIFEEFYRASNAKRVERDGSGLGLSIAKKIIELHQGKIWVQSVEGKGSIFAIELPK